MKFFTTLHSTLFLLAIFLSSHSYGQIYSGTTNIGSGATAMSFSVTINTNTNTSSISLSGPSSRWFAIGIGATSMSTGAYTLVGNVSGGSVAEYNQVNHNPPSLQSTQNLTSISTSTSGSTKTYTFSRANNTNDANDYVFSSSNLSINLIWAYGSSTTLAYHASRGITQINLSSSCNIPITNLSPIQLCPGDSTNIFNQWQNMAGTYYDTLSSNGCDSVISQTLSFNNIGPFNLPNQSICSGDSTQIFGQWISQAGDYYDTLVSSNNCDSILKISLSINPKYITQLPDTILCMGQSIQIFNQNIQSPGMYYDSLLTVNQCDSIIAIQVNMISLDTAVSKTDSSLIAMQDSASYQWYDCSNNQPIQNAINQTFIPTQSGLYKVEISQGSCVQSSGCQSFISSGIAVNQKRISNIYPNPNKGIFQLNTTHEINKILIFNALGEVIYHSNNKAQNQRIDIHSAPKGLYFLQIIYKDGSTSNSKIVVQP